MPTSGERRLKLVNGLSATGVSRTGRTVTRRTVARRQVPSTHQVEEMLRHLDEEPVERPAGAAEPVERDVPLEGDVPLERDVPVEGGESVRRSDGRRGRLRRPAPSTLLLTVALCLALAGAGVAGHRWYQDRALEQARQHALAAAKQTTVNFVSISASSVDRDLGRIVAGATGEFKEQFARGQDQVRAAVVENKVESQGSVLRAGLLSGDRTTAVALVAVDATVKNTHVPQGRDSHYRIQVDLARDRDSGAWLVSRLQFVG